MWDRLVMERGYLLGPQEHRARADTVQRRRGPAGIWAAAGLVCAALLAGTAPARAEPARPEGVWMKPGGKAAVEFFDCEEGRLCGRLVWGRERDYPDGQRLDSRNPDPSLRSRDLCGAVIIWGLDWSPPRSWRGGWVYDPTSGSTYNARLRIEGAERVQVRGYRGISLLGRSEEWQPAPPELELCTDPLTAGPSRVAGLE